MVTLILKTKVLKPTVVIDTNDHFKANYIDAQGPYEFEIKKVDKQWRVTSDGFECCKSKDKGYLLWNFESQLSAYSPRVLN